MGGSRPGQEVRGGRRRGWWTDGHARGHGRGPGPNGWHARALRRV